MNINEFDKSIDNSMFLTKVDNIFVLLYSSIMFGDIERVNHRIGDALYNKYKAIVDENNSKNIRQMYDELNVKSSEIINIEETDDKIIVTVKLISRYMDYRVNKENFNFISGNNTSRDEHINILTLEKSKNAKEMKASVHCPGCGQPANINSTGHCAYCGAIFNTEDYDYVLTNLVVM